MMKKLTLITKIVLLATILVACKQNRPEPVVEKYYTHFYRGEFDKIGDCVIKEHREFYEYLAPVAAAGKDNSEKVDVKVTDIKCDIIGDTIANCTCLINVAEGEKKHAIQLKKVDNEWLVNQGKENNMAYPDDNAEPSEE